MDIELIYPQNRTGQETLKRSVDIGGTLLIFILFSPLIFLIAITIRLTSRNTIFFRQERIGKYGKRFWMFKFRTMEVVSNDFFQGVVNRDLKQKMEFDQFQKLADDPRLTPIGRVLRRFSLDELPQLWNVLKGDMSLVGPRPFLPEQRKLYGSAFGVYCQVRPGLTGLWQVSGRNHLSFKERAILDEIYIAHRSFWTDLRILIQTGWVVIRQDGAY